MGRKRTIDRDRVLDVAEDIIAQTGGKGLTIDAVAKAAGITKGGVQYAFGTRAELIDAIQTRWWKHYDSEFTRLAGEQPDPLTTIHAHIEATRTAGPAFNAKAAGLLAALTQTPEQLGSTREWYRDRLNGLAGDDETTRRAKLAFFATEGAFLLRFFGFLDIRQSEWEMLFSDIAALTSVEISPSGSPQNTDTETQDTSLSG